MILLGIPPLRQRDNLRRNRLILIPLLGHLLGNILRDPLLFLAVREDSTAILRAHVGALLVHGRGVVHAVEEFEELAVGDDGGVEGYLEGFGVCFCIGGIVRSVWSGYIGRYGWMGEYSRPVVPEQTTRYVGAEVEPPQYPTCASSRPLPWPNSRRKRCSTPQKQPAATVAFSVEEDMVREGGVRERNGELVENGRRSREKSGDDDTSLGAKVINWLCLLYRR